MHPLGPFIAGPPTVAMRNDAHTPSTDSTSPSPHPPVDDADPPDIAAVEAAFEGFMETLDLEVADDDHLEDTPGRVARSRVTELFRGLWENPRDHLDTTFDTTSDGLVVVDNIEVSSMCAHHFLPFRGVAHVGYVPDGEVVGLSKFSRLVDGYARRPQVQERLTAQVADAIADALDPVATFVLVEAEHECMTLRGVQEPDSRTTTTAFRGDATEERRAEFFQVTDRD